MEADEDRRQVSEGLETSSQKFEIKLILNRYSFTLQHKLPYHQAEERQQWKLEKDSELRIEIAEEGKGVNLVVRLLAM